MDKNQKGFTFILIILAILFLAGVGYFIYQLKMDNKEPEETESIVLDPRNCTYTIEEKSVTLKDGYSEEEVSSDTASKIITRYFGNEASSDLNGDGLSDTAFILTQTTGGSGTFYYSVVALGDITGCKGTEGIILGDRIAPQTTEIRDGKIIVNYADRKTDEAMTASPSVGITKHFMLSGQILKDFTPEEFIKEESCLLSGGSIETSLCCGSTSDFPNNCLIGACGCSPSSSHEVKTCNCGDNKCFNGTKCN
jgi:hypothetical protein